MNTISPHAGTPGRAGRLWNHPLTFWLLLSLPSLGMLASALFGIDPKALLHPTGELSVRLMIVAMMLTPLRGLLPGARWVRWLLRRRRYLGVAAFGYAALHTLLYLIDIGSLSMATAEAAEVGIWTGWLAFLVFVPLAMTSNERSVRRLGRRWKTLQRSVYLAAMAAFAHWAFVVPDATPALMNFLPLAALETWRVWQVGSNGPRSDGGVSDREQGTGNDTGGDTSALSAREASAVARRQGTAVSGAGSTFPPPPPRSRRGGRGS